MNRVIRIMVLVIANQLFASQLGINSLTEIFWFSLVSLTGIFYGIASVLDSLNKQEDNDE